MQDSASCMRLCVISVESHGSSILVDLPALSAEKLRQDTAFLSAPSHGVFRVQFSALLRGHQHGSCMKSIWEVPRFKLPEHARHAACWPIIHRKYANVLITEFWNISWDKGRGK